MPIINYADYLPSALSSAEPVSESWYDIVGGQTTIDAGNHESKLTAEQTITAHTLEHASPKQSFRIAGDFSTNNLTLDFSGAAIGSGDYSFVDNAGVSTTGSWPLDLDEAHTDLEFILQSDDTWRIERDTGSSSSPVVVQAEQSADFTATAGALGVIHEWPVNVSGLLAGGVINVAEPVGTPTAGDSFAVFDSQLATDNGIDPPAENKRIRINFTSNLHSLPGPDFAEINSAGARIEFTYIDATVGWRIAAPPLA